MGNNGWADFLSLFVLPMIILVTIGSGISLAAYFSIKGLCNFVDNFRQRDDELD